MNTVPFLYYLFIIYFYYLFYVIKVIKIKIVIIELYIDKPKVIELTSDNDKETSIQHFLPVINDKLCCH
jgi:hypothetical protein